jgi:hypothetical protein
MRKAGGLSIHQLSGMLVVELLFCICVAAIFVSSELQSGSHRGRVKFSAPAALASSPKAQQMN